MYVKVKILLGVMAILAVTVTTANAAWSDNFDSYAAGSQLHGQGGWEGWAGDAGASAPVSNAVFFSPENSAEIIGSADLVHPYDVTGGKWTYSTMQFVPDGSTGESFFILMNQYPTNLDWSAQIRIDMNGGQIISDNGGGATAPIVWHQWTELRFEIDLDANTVDEYYDGNLLSSHQWDNDGHNTFQAVDLYGNGASSVFYDNMSLVPEPGTLAMLLGLGVLGAIAFVRRGRK